jgi:hypothetical protein
LPVCPCLSLVNAVLVGLCGFRVPVCNLEAIIGNTDRHGLIFWVPHFYHCVSLVALVFSDAGVSRVPYQLGLMSCRSNKQCCVWAGVSCLLCVA